MKFHRLIFFVAWLVYTINMYSNMKYYENICNCLRVIQQNKNRKLKYANCWQQTSLSDKVPVTATRLGACQLQMQAAPSSILASGAFFRGDIFLSFDDSRTVVGYYRMNVHSVLVEYMCEACTGTVWLGY